MLKKCDRDIHDDTVAQYKIRQKTQVTKTYYWMLEAELHLPSAAHSAQKTKKKSLPRQTGGAVRNHAAARIERGRG
jgi:hypothetical protein